MMGHPLNNTVAGSDSLFLSHCLQRDRSRLDLMHMHFSCCQWNYCSKAGFLLCVTEPGTLRDQNIVENGLEDSHGNVSKKEKKN